MALGSSGRRIVVEFIGDASALKSGVNDSEQALQGFGGKARAVGSIAGKALAGGLILAGAAAVKAGQAAAEDEAAQSQLAQQLRQAAGASDQQIASLEDWISAQGKATGITDDELRPALAKLATATGDVGEAQKLAALAMDVSAGTGKDLNQVTEALVRAQNGSIGGLSRLGVATKDASGKTMDLAQVTQLMADKYTGAAAKAADTTAGKQKILTTQMGELQEQIGARLLPVMVKLSSIGLQVVNWISENTRTAGIFIGVLGGLLAVTTAVGLATKLASTFTALWSAATKIAAAGQWLLNAALTANPIGLVVAGLALLVGGLILAYTHSEKFRSIVNAAFDACKTVVLGAINAITSAVGAVIGFIKSHWDLLLGILTGPIGLAVIEIIKHWDKIKAATSAAWDAVKNAFSSGISAVVGFVAGIPGRMRGALSNLGDTLRNVFENAMTAGKNKVEDIGGKIVGYLSGIPGKIRDAFAGIWDGLANGLKSAINAVLHLPLVIPKIDTHIPGVGTVGGQTLIPALAKGGIVTRPTMALIGEAGPEAVIPLGRRGGAAVGSTSVSVTVVSWDPKTAGQSVIAALREVERQTGRRLLVSAP